MPRDLRQLQAPPAATALTPKEAAQDWLLLTRLVGHGCPGEVHGVEGDDRGLEEARAGLMLLFKDTEARQGQKGKGLGTSPWAFYAIQQSAAA